MTTNYNYLIKCIIIGDTFVGKSNLLIQYVQKKFNGVHEITIGVEFLSKNIEIDDKIIRVQIWDTAGQESFKSITRSYYKNSACGIIVYDITNKSSFDHIRSWYKDCKELSPKTSHLILVGNKLDLDDKRQVSYDEGKNFAEENDLQFYEVSAKTGQNIEEMFKDIANTILKKIESGEINLTSELTGVKMGLNSEESKAIKLSNILNKDESKKKSCC